MAIRLYNTLTRAKDELVPGDPARVTLYVCGPTVHGRAHIGNFRPAVVFDVLQRLLRHSYGAGNVVYARNITDIDDKIIARAAAEGVPIETITERYAAHYRADGAALGVEAPDFEPRATTSVPAMVAMIEGLIGKGAAYVADGHVLFDVPAFGAYGVLSRRPLDEMIAGARVEVAPYKRSPADFVLWKPSVGDQPGWDSPWGRGRPGWHIECSAMIAEVLGMTIDIHGGGLDLQFPHHENELAQSVCAHDGAPLARIWMHNGFLSMGGGDKMSKSLGNVVTVADLLEQGWHGEVLRLALLSAHYRQPLEWTQDLLAATQARLDGFIALASDADAGGEPDAAFVEALGDDLNTPAALARLHAMAKTIGTGQPDLDAASGDARSLERRSANTAAKAVFKASAGLLGLSLAREGRSGFISAVAIVDEFAERRKTARDLARAARNFAEADRLRDELAADGYLIEDGPGGSILRKV